MSVTGAKRIRNTVRIWDVQHKTCSKILTEYGTPFTIACSPGSFLLAFTDRTVKVYDSQSHDIIQTISVNDCLTHSRFSIGGDKILLAIKNSGYI
jgi:WD40 repeat protein